MAVNLNTRLPSQRRILPSTFTPAAIKDAYLMTPAIHRRHPFCLFLRDHNLSPPAPTPRSRMLTEQKGHSKTTLKSSLPAWTSLATLVANSVPGNCNLEISIGTVDALLLPLYLTSLLRKSLWTATLWTRTAATVIAVDLRQTANVHRPADCSSGMANERNDTLTDDLYDRLQDLKRICNSRSKLFAVQPRTDHPNIHKT